MPSKLEAVFLVAASAPLGAARERFRASRIRDGLDAISRQNLEKGLHGGLSALARHSGASVTQLQQACDVEELQAALLAMDTSQRAAVEALVRFLGGTVTLPPPAPGSTTAADELRSVATLYVLDAHISGPLEACASQLAAWQLRLEAMAVQLASHRVVVGALWRRRLLRAVAALAAVLVAASLAGFFAWSRLVVRAAQQRVESALSAADPCACESVSDKDLAHATPDQRRIRESRTTECQNTREREAYEARCEALARDVENGSFKEESAPTAGASAPLLKRIAARTLEPADLRVADGAMPCQDSRAAGRFWDALAKELGSATPLWAQAEAVSPQVARLLTRKGFGLTAESDEALAALADSLARHAIKTGNPQEMTRAASICKVRGSLSLDPGRACAALDRIITR